MKSVLIILFICCAFSIFGQKIILTDQKFPENISPFITVFEDKSSKIPFEQVQTQTFVNQNKKVLFFPFSQNTYWLKFKIRNEHSSQNEWVLEWNNTFTENVDFYIPNSIGEYQVFKTGAFTGSPKVKFSEHNPEVYFNLNKNQEKTIYLRLKSHRGHVSSLSIHASDVYQANLFTVLLGKGFVYGLVFLRLFYIILIAIFSIKELAFRQYSLLLVIRSFAFFGINRVLGDLLTHDPTQAAIINIVSYHILPIGQILVVKAILPMEKFHRIVKILLYAIIAITVILSFFIIFDYRWNWLLASTYLVIFTQLFIFGLYIFAISKKLTFNIYYSVPFLLGIGSYIFMQMRLVGWFGLLDFNWILTLTLFFFISEIFVFGLFLGRIIINYERTRATSAKQLIFTQTQTNKLQELDALKTNFFANISHEFRTPLTLILSPLEDLLKEFPKKEIYQIMHRNANRLLSLINQLLDLSKLEAGQMHVELEKVELVRYFRTRASAFSSLAESREIGFELTQNKAECWGLIDIDKTEKILTNLLSNAFKFTKKGKTVFIIIEFPTQKSEQLTIKIKDEGIGISKEKLPRIFDRFYQVESAQNRGYEGTGIGLALVKELVEVLNGEIFIESEEDFGTTVTLKLPIESYDLESELVEKTVKIIEFPEPNAEAVLLNSEAALMHYRGEIGERRLNRKYDKDLLLIIDDNADIRQYISRIFEEEYQIIEAIDGEDGLQKAIERVPDVIISDLMMPKMDGFELCKNIKTNEATSHIPVILLTAKATVESRIEGFEQEADDYLTKPFNTDEIKARVRNVILIREKLKKYFAEKIDNLIPHEVKISTLDEVFIQKAIAIIEQNLSNSKFDVVQFSEEMNISPSQLLRKFKALTNLTINEFVRDFRLQRAAELLKNKSGTVSEIAFQVGFEHLSYFSKMFQEKFGKLPSEY